MRRLKIKLFDLENLVVASNGGPDSRPSYFQSPPGNSQFHAGISGGFTLVELLFVAGLLGFLGLVLVPVLAGAKPNPRLAQCQNNLRRLGVAWSMYAAETSDQVVNNFGVNEISSTISSGAFANWANNSMSWGASSSVADRGNTNIVWAASGPLGSYLGGMVSVYHCPSDTYLSSVQRAAGWTARLRSVSMNSVFGRFSSSSVGDPTASGLNWADSRYAQYLRAISVPKPAKTWVLIEEHPDSINDGLFVNVPTTSAWQDIPASYHNGGCSLSFADGHTEIKRWQSPTSWYRVQLSYPAPRTFDSLGRIDFAWYLGRTGYIDAQTRQPMFGY